MERGAQQISPADDQAIKAVVRGYEACWNRHDMAALSELFADDAHWVNIVGMYWSGKAAVVRAHEGLHSTFFRTTEQALIDVTVRAIAPGVAIAVAHLKMGPFTPPDGVHRPAAGNRLSFTLTKQSGGWRIAHGHNTVIDPAAQPFDPAIQSGFAERG
jgi:uncharacterized protein (TIGR02246 family)